MERTSFGLAASWRSLRRTALIAAIGTGCAFPDPFEPPPPDPCLAGAPARPSDGRYYTVKIDGVPGCSDSARGDDEDTIVVFTGSAWNAESALCRARDAFFGVIAPGTAVTPQSIGVDEPFDDAIGYCVVNAGTTSEIMMVSVCGQRDAGKFACENTLRKGAKGVERIATEWSACPEGERCPEVPDEPCLTEAGDGKSYAAYVDVEPIRCGDHGQADDRDTLLVTTQGGWSLNTSACLAQGPHVHAISIGSASKVVRGSFELAKAPLVHSSMREGLEIAGTSDLPAPRTSPLGYCLVYEGEQIEYVLYSFCEQVQLPEAALADATLRSRFSPQALCESMQVDGSTRTSVPRTSVREVEADGGVVEQVSFRAASGRPSRWVSCTGPVPGPLCFSVPAARGS